MPSVRAGIKSIKWTQPHPAGFSTLWLPEAQGYRWVPFRSSVPTDLRLIAAPKACEKRQVTQALEAWLGMCRLLGAQNPLLPTPPGLPAPGSSSGCIPLPGSGTVPADGLLASRCCHWEVLSGVAGRGLVLACQT